MLPALDAARIAGEKTPVVAFDALALDALLAFDKSYLLMYSGPSLSSKALRSNSTKVVAGSNLKIPPVMPAARKRFVLPEAHRSMNSDIGSRTEGSAHPHRQALGSFLF